MFPALRYLIVLFFCCCGLLPVLHAQHLSFRHLGIEEGLTGNNMSHACFDSSGLIWISSYDGITGYDGNRIRQYSKETHPALPGTDLQYLHCDSHNRIWICSGEGLSLLDEHRRIQRIIISDTIRDKDVNYCIEAPGLGIIAFAPRKTYLLREGHTNWEPYTWADSVLKKGNDVSNVTKFSKGIYSFICANRVMLVDFSRQKVLTDLTIETASRLSVTKINDQELLAVNGTRFEMYRIHIQQNKIIKKYEQLADEKGHVIETAPVYCALAANGIIYITSRSKGLISFDPISEKVQTYLHQPLNERSVSADNLRRVFCHPQGYLITTSTSGADITNVSIPVFRQQKKFADDHGTVTDNITMAGEDANGRIWLRGLNELLIWDPVSDKARNITPAGTDAENELTREAGSIFRDNDGNMWVSYNGKGIAKFNSNGQQLTFLSKETNKLPSNRVRIIRQLKDHRLIIGTENGFFLLNPATGQSDTLADHPLLKPVLKKRVVDILPDGDGAWIACSPNGGCYYYDFKKPFLKSFTTNEGFQSTRVYCIGKDLQGNIYAGGFDGLAIISKTGTIKLINKGNGLRHFRVDNILADKEGRMWITNYNTLICYNPADQSFTYFDEKNGVSNAGFTVGQAVRTQDGRFLFCNDGLLMVDPGIPWKQESLPSLAINRLYDDGGYDLLNPAETVVLPHNDSKFSLYYFTNSLTNANRILYRYKMDGLDTGWQQPTKNNQVYYNLKPGTYVFHLQASSVEGNWQQTGKSIRIQVLPPWWQTWWFTITAFFVTALLVYVLFRRRIRVIKDRARLQQQMTELEGKALRAQMNPHFIFNSLNAIQELIMTNKTEEGYQYLSNFSKLLRHVLHNSEKNLIPLSAELEMLRLQLSLESLRFKNSFTYTFTVDDTVEAELIAVPPLLLQPYVENAVWHGLRHQEGEKNLFIRIHEDNGMLHIEIEDNGVGRARAEEIRKQKLGAGQFESKGSELSEQRIRLINDQYPGTATVTIEDLKTENQQPAGTRVIIRLPVNLK